MAAGNARIARRLNEVTLQRALSKLGCCSRSQAEATIRSGSVRVNNKQQTNPHLWINIVRDRIVIDGKEIRKNVLRYVLFHKPCGVVATRSDERGQKTIYDILDNELHALKTVGRLDKDTSGLLLLTNDHQCAERLTNPENHVEKIYEVEISRSLNSREEETLRNGISIQIDGCRYITRPATLRAIGKNTYHIGLTEGKNRQVRKMFAAVGSEVVTLKRIAVGRIKLGLIPPGSWRDLSDEEILSITN